MKYLMGPTRDHIASQHGTEGDRWIALCGYSTNDPDRQETGLPHRSICRRCLHSTLWRP